MENFSDFPMLYCAPGSLTVSLDSIRQEGSRLSWIILIPCCHRSILDSCCGTDWPLVRRKRTLEVQCARSLWFASHSTHRWSHQRRQTYGLGGVWVGHTKAPNCAHVVTKRMFHGMLSTMSRSLGFFLVCRSQTRNNTILSIGYGAEIFSSIGFLLQTSMLPPSPIPHGAHFLGGHLIIYSRCLHHQLRRSQRQLAAGWTSRSCLVTAGKKFPWVVNMQCPTLHGVDKHMIQVFPFQMMSSVMFYMTSMKLAFTLTLFLLRILQTALTWILICAWSLSDPAFPPTLVPKYQQSWDLQTVDCRHLLYNTVFCIFLQWGLWSWVGMPLLIGHSPLNCRSPNHLSSTQSQRLFDWRRL